MLDCLQYFAKDISCADWDRFHTYASRVRHLDYSYRRVCHGTTTSISEEALCEFLMFRPSNSAVLPHLKSLAWWARDNDTFLSLLSFVSPGLKELNLRWSGPTSHPCIIVLNALAGRKLSLTTLTLYTVCNEKRLMRSLGRLLRQQKNLITARLSPYLASAEVVHALGRCHFLSEFSWRLRQDRRTGLALKPACNSNGHLRRSRRYGTFPLLKEWVRPPIS